MTNPIVDRRVNGSLDEARFSTQKIVTYILLLIFSAVTMNVLVNNDQSERSMILQTVINITLLAVGYWLGSSKAATDSNAAIGQIAKAAAPSTAAAVAAATAPQADQPAAQP